MTGSAKFPMRSKMPPILQRVAYFDSVRLLIPRHLSKAEQARLKALDPQMHYSAKDQNGSCGIFCKHRGRSVLFLATVTFQYLTPRLIEALDEFFSDGPPPLVNSAHLALDLVVATQLEADAVQDFIEARFLKRGHRGIHGTALFKTTRYFGRRGRRSVVAIYTDKPCRIISGPCCHIERRLQGRKTLREQGLTTLRDLIEFDPRSFWSRALSLIDLQSDVAVVIGELLYRHGPRRQLFRDRKDTEQRWRIIAGTFLRWVAAQEGSYPYPTATGLDAALKQFGLPPLRKFGKPIDVSGLLPSSLVFKSVPDQ
jgi:hypothetical protein